MHHSELQEERKELNYRNLITQNTLVGLKVSTISILTYEDTRNTIANLQKTEMT